MAKIQTRGSLRKWLDGRSPEVITVIAARSALRALPGLGVRRGIDAEWRTAIILPTKRAIAASWVAALVPTQLAEVRVAAAYAAAARAASHAADADSADADAAYAAADAARAARAASHAADAARAASHAADSADAADAADAAARAARAAARASHASHAAASHAAVWQVIERDCDLIEDGTAPGDVARLPLWHDAPMPEALADLWQRLKRSLNGSREGWQVWTRWYDARLKGAPVNLPLEEARVLSPTKEDWKKGPKHINAILADLIVEHRGEASPTGKTFEISKATGNIDLRAPRPAPAVEVARTPERTLMLLRRRLGRDIEPLREGNRFTALFPAFDRLELVLDDEPFFADDLHDEMQALRDELRILIREGYVEKGAELSRLDKTLKNGIGDLRAHFEDITIMVTARREATIGRITEKQLDAMEKAVEAFADIVEPAVLETYGRELSEVAKAKAAKAEAEDGVGPPVPDGPLKRRLYKLRTYLSEIYRLAGKGKDKLVEIMEKGVAVAKKLEAYEKARAKLEPLIRQLINFLIGDLGG